MSKMDDVEIKKLSLVQVILNRNRIQLIGVMLGRVIIITLEKVVVI